MLLTLDHIQLAIPVGEEAAARHFWCDILGLTEVVKPDTLAGRGGCWFEQGGLAVHVGVEEPFRPQQKAHPAFAVTDLDRLAAKLERHDYAVQWDDKLLPRRRFYTADPFGNRLEFLANL